MASPLQEKLRDLIAKGKSRQAFDALAEQLKGTDEGNTIVLLRSRWNANQRSYNMGVLANSDYLMETNRVNYALLSVIGELEEAGPANGPNSTQQKAEAAITQVINNTYNISGDHVVGNKTITNVHGDNFTGNKVTTNVQGNYVGGDQHIGTDKQVEKDQPVKKKTILFIAANPQGKSETNSAKEKQKISDAINNGTLRDQFELQDNFSSNVGDLLRILKKFKPAIVHLSMHGAKEGMLFENASGGVDFLSADLLASFFELLNSKEKIVELVVLSACNSVEHAQAVNEFVDYAVGMNGPIPTDVAVNYTSDFYTNLLEGDDYESSHQSSILLLRQYAGKVDWHGEVAIKDMPKLFKPRGVASMV